MLKESYKKALEMIKNYDRRQGEYGMGGSLGIAVHSAYHLREQFGKFFVF